MNPPHPIPSIDQEPSVLRAERRLRLLEKMADTGMRLLEGLECAAAAGEAAGAGEKGSLGEPADAFARLSRAIRLTLALEARTDRELFDLTARVISAREHEDSKIIERNDRTRREKEMHVLDLVRRAANHECERVEDLHEIFHAAEERLSEDDAYENFEERPLRETIERLCRDLTLTPDWTRWDGEDWIEDNPPRRSRFSIFHTPSARALLSDSDGAKFEKPVRPWRMIDGRAVPAKRTAAAEAGPDPLDSAARANHPLE
jgi:hypothetical protein